MIIWMVVNHSITMTKTISDIPVKVKNLSSGKTIEGLQTGGYLNRKISLTLTGTRAILDDIASSDLEVVIDALDKPEEWTAFISKQNLFSSNPEIDLTKAISKVSPYEITIKQNRLISEKIPVRITRPIGEAPKGYQFLDIWPYQLYLTVTGPEETLKKLKSRGLKLSFNLNNISKTQLDTLQANKISGQLDEVSFFVPNSWKKILISELSDTPFEIDGPQANALRINFTRQDLLPIGSQLPITVYYPQKYSQILNPETYQLAINDFITKKNGIKMVAMPLYAQGVSRLFLDTVKDMIQLVVIAAPKSEMDKLLWNADFLYPQELENRYVARVLSESQDEVIDLLPHLREDYLRNRFRSYMNRFRLYTPDHKKLKLDIELQANTISVVPENYP